MNRIFALALFLLGGCSAEEVFPSVATAEAADASADAVVSDAATHDLPGPGADAAPVDAAAGPEVTPGDAAAPDAGSSDAGSSDAGPSDIGPDADAGAGGDAAGADSGSPCGCQPSEIWLHGPCVPTTLLGCSGVKTCIPGGCPGSATGQEVCDGSAASPACVASSLLPVCVKGPSMGFAAGSLRAHPTQASVGTTVKMQVRGGVFYIGALYWVMTVGNEVLGSVDEGGTCLLTSSWTPKTKGVFPVTAYYGTPDHGPGTVAGTLAGFISVDAGDPGVQPGQPCKAADTCAQAAPWKCGCAGGRCVCGMK